jgi:hypothetical protein
MEACTKNTIVTVSGGTREGKRKDHDSYVESLSTKSGRPIPLQYGFSYDPNLAHLTHYGSTDLDRSTGPP